MDGFDYHVFWGPVTQLTLVFIVGGLLALNSIRRAKARKTNLSKDLKAITVHFAGIDDDTPEAKALRRIVARLNKSLERAVNIVTTPREPENGLIAFTANPLLTLTFDPPAGQPDDPRMRTLCFRRIDLTDVIEELLFLRLAAAPEPAGHYRFLDGDRTESHTMLMAYVGEMRAETDTIDIIFLTIRYGHWLPAALPQLEALIDKALVVITPGADPARWRYLQNCLINIRRETGRLRDALVIAEAAEAHVPASDGLWVTELKYAIGLEDKNEAWVEASLDHTEAAGSHVLATKADDRGSHSHIRLHLAERFLKAGQMFDRRDWLSKARHYAQQCLETSPSGHGAAFDEDRADDIVAAVDAVLPTDSGYRVTVSASKTLH